MRTSNIIPILNNRGRRTLCLWFFLLFPGLIHAQNPPGEPAAPAPEEKPIVANLCPKFALIGVPRRIKLYGANLSEIQLKAEDDLIFSDYKTEPDSLSLTVTVEASPTARSGKRQILVIDRNTVMVQSLTFYLLKREDRALLQKDLLRCPPMKEEGTVKSPKPSPSSPPRE